MILTVGDLLLAIRDLDPDMPIGVHVAMGSGANLIAEPSEISFTTYPPELGGHTQLFLMAEAAVGDGGGTAYPWRFDPFFARTGTKAWRICVPNDAEVWPGASLLIRRSDGIWVKVGLTKKAYTTPRFGGAVMWDFQTEAERDPGEYADEFRSAARALLANGRSENGQRR